MGLPGPVPGCLAGSRYPRFDDFSALRHPPSDFSAILMRGRAVTEELSVLLGHVVLERLSIVHNISPVSQVRWT